MTTRKMITPTLVLLMLALCGSVRADDAELKRLRAENAELKARVARLEAELAKLRKTTEKLAEEKRELVVEQATKQAKSDAHYVSETKSDDGKTLLSTRPTAMPATHGTRDPHWMSARVSPGGDTVTLVVKTSGSGGAHSSTDTIIFTADGQEISAKVTDYDADRRTIGAGRTRRRVGDETITATLSLADLKRITEAKDVSIRMGPARFAFDHEQRVALEVLARMAR